MTGLSADEREQRALETHKPWNSAACMSNLEQAQSGPMNGSDRCDRDSWRTRFWTAILKHLKSFLCFLTSGLQFIFNEQKEGLHQLLKRSKWHLQVYLCLMRCSCAAYSCVNFGNCFLYLVSVLVQLSLFVFIICSPFCFYLVQFTLTKSLSILVLY